MFLSLQDITRSLRRYETSQPTVKPFGPFDLSSKPEIPFLSPSLQPDIRKELYKKILESSRFYPDELESGGRDVLRIHSTVQRMEAQDRLRVVLEAFTDLTKYPM